MITEVKTYYCDHIPSNDELFEVYSIAYNNRCYVRLEYNGYGYPYSTMIHYTESFNDIKAKMPKCYGL